MKFKDYDQFINESTDDQFLKSREEIAKWLDSMGIKGYTINDDLTVDVDGNVDLSSKKFKRFPVQFGKVGGHFSCYGCTGLTTLKGAPQEVGGGFYCNSCANLTSLEGAPQEVGGGFYCNSCANLTSLEGAPREVVGNFSCGGCINLTSLEGAPQKVGGDFSCHDCTSLISLEGVPQTVGGDFFCRGCTKLTSLEGVPQTVGGDFFCVDTPVEYLVDYFGNYKKAIAATKEQTLEAILKCKDDRLKNELLSAYTPEELHKYRGIIHGTSFGI